MKKFLLPLIMSAILFCVAACGTTTSKSSSTQTSQVTGGVIQVVAAREFLGQHRFSTGRYPCACYKHRH